MLVNGNGPEPMKANFFGGVEECGRIDQIAWSSILVRET